MAIGQSEVGDWLACYHHHPNLCSKHRGWDSKFCPSFLPMRDFIHHFCEINLAPFLQNHSFRFHSWSWWNGMLQLSVYALSEVREIIVSLSLCGSVPQIGLCIFSAHLHYRSSQIQLSKLSIWWCMNNTVTSAKDKLTTVIKISKRCWKCRKAEWKSRQINCGYCQTVQISGWG